MSSGLTDLLLDKVLEWHHLPYLAQVVFQLWGQLEMDLFASSCTNYCQHYYILMNLLPLGILGDAINHPWKYHISFVFLPLALVSLVLLKFLLEHITGQPRLLILLAPCLKEASWIPTVLNMLTAFSSVC